jgi:hypothetical protein
MSEAITTKLTTLPAEEVIVRAVQFFATEKWKPTGQSARTATFEGKIPIPWGMMVLTILGFMVCLVPGIILYFMLIRKVHRFQNLVVTATTKDVGTEVVIRHPNYVTVLVAKYAATLPKVPPCAPLG